MKPLQKQTLVDQAVSGLMDYIHVNKLQPGAVLPGELQLADTFGVSRPVVREALRTLHGRAVVNLVSGKGAIVRPLDGKAFNDFFARAMAQPDLETGLMMEEARHGLETQCALLAATRRTAEHVRQLEEIVVEMREVIGDKTAYWKLNLAFHRVIAEASGNHMLGLMVVSLQDAMDRVFTQQGEEILVDRLWPAMHPLHEKIFEHIRAREPREAAMVTFEHLELAMQLMRRKR
ncbi:MAG: FadR/GntR family transcriptional regulator [Verrucomicrobiota bacterium]